MAMQEIGDPTTQLQAVLAQLKRISTGRHRLRRGTAEYAAALDRENDLAREVRRLIEAELQTA